MLLFATQIRTSRMAPRIKANGRTNRREAEIKNSAEFEAEAKAFSRS